MVTESTIQQQATDAAIYAVMNPSEFPNVDQAGHALVGAMAAGADREVARQVAVAVHMSGEQFGPGTSMYREGALGFLLLQGAAQL